MQKGTLAVLLMGIATFLTALGIVLMKKAHNDKESPKIVILRTPWILGLCSKIISAVLAVISFSMANQSTLSPICALTMVYNVILAWKILNEPFNKYDLIAVFLMCGGAALAEIYSTKTTIPLDYNDLDILFSKLQSVVYIMGGYAVYITLWMVSKNIIQNGKIQQSYIGKIPLITYGTFTGFQSGITGLCLKATVELIKTQVNGEHNFDYHPAATLFPISTIISVFLHLFILNTGLKYYDALQMVPLVQSSMIVYNILTGGIVLNEFATFNSQSRICFPLGTVICCLGIFIILFKNRNVVLFQVKTVEPDENQSEKKFDESIGCQTEQSDLENCKNSRTKQKEILQLNQIIIQSPLDSENPNYESANSDEKSNTPNTEAFIEV